MTYRISIEKPAAKFINSQPKNQRVRLIKAIQRLPLVGDIKSVEGHPGYFRLRVGDYRIIYTIVPETQEVSLVLVSDAGNRGDIYNRY